MSREILTEDNIKKAIKLIEKYKKTMIDMTVEEVSQIFKDNDLNYYNANGYFNQFSTGQGFYLFLHKVMKEYKNELQDDQYDDILYKTFMAVGISKLDNCMRPEKEYNWYNLSEEEKTEIISETLNFAKKWYKEYYDGDDINRIRTDIDLADDFNKHAVLYTNNAKKYGNKLKQALHKKESKEIETLFNNIDRDYYKYYLLYDALDELYNELSTEDYKLIIEQKISWLGDGFEAKCKTMHGLADDRKLFYAVKHVIDEWDPENFLACGCPDDEYDILSGYYTEMLKSSDNHDLNSVAWGMYNINSKQFGYTKRRKSVFPAYIFIAGKLLKSIRNNGLENICNIKESPYTLQELQHLDVDLKKRRIEMEKVSLDLAKNSNIKVKSFDNFLRETYEDLKIMYPHLSKHDMDSLHEYCFRGAKSKLWRNRRDAYDVLDDKFKDFRKY